MDSEIKKQINTINQKINELNALYRTAATKSGIPDGEISIWSHIGHAGSHVLGKEHL